MIKLHGSEYKLSISPIGLIVIVYYDPLEQCEVNFKRLDQLKGIKYTIKCKDISKVMKIENSYKGEGYEEVLIESKGQNLLFDIREKREMIDVIGSHINRYKKAKIQLFKRLKEMFLLKNTKYDSTNEDHENLLMSLWSTIFPNVKLNNRRSKQWVDIGFQGEDPATDFRGMGLLGLQNCVYFAKRYTSFMRNLCSSGRDYPFCVAGINVTSFLLDLLNLKNLIDKDISDPMWNTPLFEYLCIEEMIHGKGFEEFYCKCMIMLDNLFIESNSTYMEFPVIFEKLQNKIKDDIQKQ